jgi:hypothetical protein
VPLPLTALPALLAQGSDVCRSLADAGGTLLVLDVDYNTPADPGEPYRDPAACFARVEPSHEAVKATFAVHGIAPLVLMTGRGYHYVARAVRGGALHRALLEFGRESRLPVREDRLGARARADEDMERAHHAAGRILEFLLHAVVREANPRSPVPVALADLPPADGGPFVCLDITAYADPVVSRHTRCAFSSNQKAFLTAADPGEPFVLVLPRAGGSYDDLLPARRDIARAAWLADWLSAGIPDVADAPAWRTRYAASPLAALHAELDAGLRDAVPADEEAPGEPAPCVHPPLRHPNPWLLQPRHLRTVTLGLWSAGWPPGAIAREVQARFEEPHGWGGLWARYDPASRAAFYVRLFCGAAAAGLEDGAFGCESQATLGLCPGGPCEHDLARELAHARAAGRDRRL